MPIDQTVMERVTEQPLAMQIAWAVTVAASRANQAVGVGGYQGLLKPVINPSLYQIGTLDELFLIERQLIHEIRVAACHANYALDLLDALVDMARAEGYNAGLRAE